MHALYQRQPRDAPAASTPGLTRVPSLHCVSCTNRVVGTMAYRCPECGGVLEVDIRLTRQRWDAVTRPLVGASMWMYRERLPVGLAEPVTLGEGCTPLIEAPAEFVGGAFVGRILLKDETGNPTGSFKDRLVSVAISRAVEDGYAAIVCASTGNAGASAAAYAARAGIPCVVCVPALAPPAKLRQIQAYGAHFVAVHGTYSDAWAVADGLERVGPFANVTTTYQNPFGVAGLRTVAYELLDAMDGQVPDAVFVPTGSGPLVRGVQWGYEEAVGLGLAERVPALVAVQAEGCAPIVRAFEAGESAVKPWGTPTTTAAGIADPLQGYAEDGSYTLAMVRKSRGWAIAVPDDAIRDAADGLARRVGVFAELSGAAGLAGMRASLARGLLSPTATAVVLVTGSGFKDLESRVAAPASRLDFDPATDDIGHLADKIRGCDLGTVPRSEERAGRAQRDGEIGDMR
jgi:threonine synthase